MWFGEVKSSQAKFCLGCGIFHLSSFGFVVFFRGDTCWSWSVDSCRAIKRQLPKELVYELWGGCPEGRN
jgi:hypothetical protein